MTSGVVRCLCATQRVFQTSAVYCACEMGLVGRQQCSTSLFQVGCVAAGCSSAMSNVLPSTQDCHWNSSPDSCHITTPTRILSHLDMRATQLWSHRVADTLTHTAALSPRKRDRLAQQTNAELQGAYDHITCKQHM